MLRTKSLPVLLLFSLAALALLWCPCQGKTDRNAAHPHPNVLKGYNPGPFDIKLSRKDEDVLASGHPVMKQTPAKDPTGGGGAICVQDVEAPSSAVWNQILDTDAYKGKVPKVLTSKNYSVNKNRQGVEFKTKMILGVLPGYSVRLHILPISYAICHV
jgi:hypothetical protein